MKLRNLIAIAGVAVLAGACIPSVNPFYTDKDVVFDARLLGEWQKRDKTDEPETWRFEKSGDKAYKLTVTEEAGNQGQFEAHLFKLKQEHFLDIIPSDCNYATNQADLVGASMFPGHLLFRVTQLEPELRVASFNYDWLAKHLEKNPRALAHHKEGKTGSDSGRILLTAETRDLQKFVLKHLSEGELFDKTGEMIRQTSGVSAAGGAAK